jgi:hypothetical protein
MSLRGFAGVAVAIALVSTPAFACKGRNTAFSDDFAVEDASWQAVWGEFSVGSGRAQVKSEPGKFALVLNTGDTFENGDACLDVIAPNYRTGQYAGMAFNTNLEEGSLWFFLMNSIEGTAAVVARKKGADSMMAPVAWRPVDSIKRQAGATNTLRLTVKNNKGAASINDKQFAAFGVNPSVKPALFGLVAATEGGVWQFDNYKITE